MPDRTFVLAILAVLLTATATGEPVTPGTGTPGDDDSRISASEVVASSIDSRDPAWKPGYTWFEDARSLECGGRRACEDHRAVETAKAENRTGAS